MSVGISQRSPETCPLREAGPGTSEAVCRLLADVLSDCSASAAQVSVDICRACCRSFEPTPRDYNPVVASIIWGEAESRLADPDCSNADHWRDLLAKAEAGLPVLFPDEDDLPAVPLVPQADTKRLTVADIERVLPYSTRRSGLVTHWAVGVTTAPRRVPTLGPCLQSLIAAGWDQPHLFVDGEMEIPSEFSDLPRTVRAPSIGARQSYYLAIAELLQRHPSAEVLMLVQDDALWPTNLPVRQYLEQALWPGDEPGLVSAWCCSDDTAPTSGWHPILRPWRFGAVVFLFPRSIAEQFIRDPGMQLACGSSPETPSGGLSMLIGNWAAQSGIAVHYPTPSLVQHIGDVSTIWENSRAVGVRHASRFLGDEVRPTPPPRNSESFDK